MNTRFYIIIAVTIIAIGAFVTLISVSRTSQCEPKKGDLGGCNSTVGEPVELLIQKALETGGVSRPDSKNHRDEQSKLKKIIRNRSNYAKKLPLGRGKEGDVDRGQKPGDVALNTDNRLPITDNSSSSNTNNGQFPPVGEPPVGELVEPGVLKISSFSKIIPPYIYNYL